jgi:hypothetical protein
MDLTQEQIDEARSLLEGAWATVYAEWVGAVTAESIEGDRRASMDVFDELARRAGFTEQRM